MTRSASLASSGRARGRARTSGRWPGCACCGWAWRTGSSRRSPSALMRRESSPSGKRSILMTSAPSSASTIVQYGPDRKRVRSSTRKPSRGSIPSTSFPYRGNMCHDRRKVPRPKGHIGHLSRGVRVPANRKGSIRGRVRAGSSRSIAPWRSCVLQPPVAGAQSQRPRPGDRPVHQHTHRLLSSMHDNRLVRQPADRRYALGSLPASWCAPAQRRRPCATPPCRS